MNIVKRTAALLAVCSSLSVSMAATHQETLAKNELRKTQETEDLMIQQINFGIDAYYAFDYNGSRRFFNTSSLIEKYGLTKLQAVDFQFRFRKETEALASIRKAADKSAHKNAPTPGQFVATAAKVAAPQSNGDIFEKVMADVKSADYKSPVDLAKIKSAKFIAVFDLDETLYDRKGASEDCHTFKYKDYKQRYVQMTPGWESAIKNINKLGGAVVLFTADLHKFTDDRLKLAQIDGKSIYDSPLIHGVLFNGHMTQTPANRKAGIKPIVEPYKDLSVLEESLSKTIIIDDNPKRVFNDKNFRLIKKFRANEYCTGSPAVKKAYENLLPTVTSEIESSLKYAEANGVTFAQAYAPYTVLGKVAVDFLKSSMTEAEAIKQVRAGKNIDKKF